MSQPPPPRRPPASFTPRFTLSLIYLFGFFFLYCAALVVPALWDIVQAVPADIETNPASQAATTEAAKLAAKEIVRPRLLGAFLASVLTVAVGAWAGRLPGMKA